MQGLFRDYLEARIRSIEAKSDLEAVLQAYRENGITAADDLGQRDDIESGQSGRGAFAADSLGE